MRRRWLSEGRRESSAPVGVSVVMCGMPVHTQLRTLSCRVRTCVALPGAHSILGE